MAKPIPGSHPAPKKEHVTVSDYEQRYGENAAQAEYWNDRAAPVWIRHQRAMDEWLSPLTDALIARTEPTTGERVIDVGCGCGATVLELASRVGGGGRVLGVDISEPLLDVARSRCRHLPQAELEVGDVQRFPFPDRGFDVAFSRLGVMFFADPREAFGNLLRALRPGGRLRFACWGPPERNPWFTVPLGVARRHLGPSDPTPPRAPGPLAFSEPDYVHDILRDAGLRDVRIDELESTMASGESAERQADVYMSLGPAARLIAAAKPEGDQLDRLRADMVGELRRYETGEGIALEAMAFAVSAER